MKVCKNSRILKNIRNFNDPNISFSCSITIKETVEMLPIKVLEASSCTENVFKKTAYQQVSSFFGLLNKSLSFTTFYVKMSANLETFPKILQVVFNLVFISSWWQFHIQFCTIGTKGINNLKVVDVKKTLLYCRHYQLWSYHFKFKIETEKQLLSAQASKKKEF